MPALIETDPTLPRPLRVLRLLIDWAIVLAGAALLVIVFGNALTRFVIDVNMNASLLWATFLGCAAAAARGTHMRIGELVALLGPQARLAVELAVEALACLTLLALVWYGALITISNWSEQTDILEWPVGLHYLAMPVGSGLTLVFVVHGMWRRWSARPG